MERRPMRRVLDKALPGQDRQTQEGLNHETNSDRYCAYRASTMGLPHASHAMSLPAPSALKQAVPSHTSQVFWRGGGWGARDWFRNCGGCAHGCCPGQRALLGRRILGRLPRLRLRTGVWLCTGVFLRLRTGLWIRTRLFVCVWSRLSLRLWSKVLWPACTLCLRRRGTSRSLRQRMGARRPPRVQGRPRIPRCDEHPRRQSASLAFPAARTLNEVCGCDHRRQGPTARIAHRGVRGNAWHAIIVVMARIRAELDAAPNDALAASFAGTRSSLGDCFLMNIAIAMLGYLAAAAALAGGLAGGVVLLARPGDAQSAAAPQRVAPIPPRIADSIERKKPIPNLQPRRLRWPNRSRSGR